MGEDQVFFVGSEPEDLAAARDWIAERLHHSWLIDDEIAELNLAVTEALTNLLQHVDVRTKSEIRVQIEQRAVHVFISDDSPPFEPGEPGDNEREGGFGLLLLHMLTDEVDIRPGDTGGSVLRLTKNRPADG
jgi:anti-sigma regulatory factor (Ser/Thr protein kinase)